jgi:hypothetical protein
LVELGYFTFAINFINLGILFVSDFISAAQPRIWAELAKGERAVVARQIRNLAVVVIFATCLAVSVAQALFGALVVTFVPSFRSAITLFEVLAFVLVCGTAGVIPAQVLGSSTVNRQGVSTLLYAVGIPINAFFAIGAIAAGYGLIGIALASVVAQGLVAVGMLLAARHELSSGGSSLLWFYGSVSVPIVASGAVAFVASLDSLSYIGASDVWSVAAMRMTVVITVWGLLAAAIVVTRKRWASI